MTKTQTIETLETDLKQYLLDQWGIKQRRRYSIFFNDDWHVGLQNLPLLRLHLAIYPNLHTRYNTAWSKVQAFVIHSRFRSNICIKNSRSHENIAGNLIYDQTKNIYTYKNTFCHEFTHVCSYHLRLPHWLNEGLAMLTVEKYFNIQTVNYSTLELLKQHPQHMLTSKINLLIETPPEIIACQYTAGYWLSRYLHEQHPDSFKFLLAKPRKEKEITNHLTKVCGLDIQNLNTTVLNYFNHETTI